MGVVPKEDWKKYGDQFETINSGKLTGPELKSEKDGMGTETLSNLLDIHSLKK